MNNKNPYMEEDFYFMPMDEVVQLGYEYKYGIPYDGWELENFNAGLSDIYENPPIAKYFDPIDGVGYKAHSPYPKEFNQSLKIKIRQRDKFICFMCKDREIISSFHVHHIDYNKSNCEEYNLITLCPGCHGRTHKKRNYWKDYFEKRLNYE